MRKAFALAMVFALSLPAWLGAGSPPARAEAGIATLEFAVQGTDGDTIHLHFSVRAVNGEEARAAVRGLLPGATPVVPSPGGVTAQHAPWGWAWADGEIPVRVAYNPDGAVQGVGPEAIAAALEAWNGVPNSRFAFRYGGFTGRPASLHERGVDRENTVAWAHMDCALGCVLGVTARHERMHEADILLNLNPQAKLGDGTNGTVDARTVLTHELGHVAGLEHSCPDTSYCTGAQEAAVMYYRYSGIRRALREDDIAGLSGRYPGLSSAAPPAPTLPEESEAAPAIDVTLRPGWNLLVLPSSPVESFIGALPCAAAVYGWSTAGWATWVRGAPPGFLPMSTSEGGKAYWVFADGGCAATFP